MPDLIPIDDDPEEEDAWSYSFPPSTDSLPLPQSKKSSTQNLTSTTKATSNSSSSVSSTSEQSKLKVQVDSTKSNKVSLSISSSMSKSNPLDPLTTKEDASSVVSKDSNNNNALSESSPKVEKPKFIKDLEVYESSSQIPTSPINSNDEPSLQPSPKIIAYRKSKRTVSEGNFDSIMNSPTSPPAPKFDDKLYVDEFYKDSDYRYAIMKRNIDFHRNFKSLDLTDRLLDDFACALSREILLQGRIYISESYVCFNSNLLGWVTNLVVKMEDIAKIEKRSTAGLFPNAISIETLDGTIHTFASFLSRDQTYDMMETVWKGATGKTENDVENESTNISQDEVNNKDKNEESSNQIEDYILSIDGDEDEFDDEESDYDDNDDDDDDDENNENDLVTDAKLVKLKPDSPYTNRGPDSHTPTCANYEKLADEIEITEELFDAPIGIVFALLFGPYTKFQTDFLETHDGSEISKLDDFHPSEQDPAVLERHFTYRRALGYSIGPKSTKCEVTESIEHLNFADYIIVVSTTCTPDVPSGGVFKVKTRYVFTWAKENKTNLVIYHHVQWSGRSWMKSVIEKSSLSGSTSITKEMMKELKEEIGRQTYCIAGPPMARVSLKKKQKKAEAEVKPVTVAAATTTKVEVTSYSVGDYLRQNISSVVTVMFTIIMIILYLQIGLFGMVKETNLLVKNQILLSIQLADIQNSNFNIPDNEYWDLINDKLGRKLSSLEKLQFLTYQLQTINKEKSDSGYKGIKKSLGRIPKYVQDLL
ncbi:LAM5 Membrane-anchored lipid-binding protein LAM5 [Candida maltosa Xu316]